MTAFNVLPALFWSSGQTFLFWVVSVHFMVDCLSLISSPMASTHHINSFWICCLFESYPRNSSWQIRTFVRKCYPLISIADSIWSPVWRVSYLVVSYVKRTWVQHAKEQRLWLQILCLEWFEVFISILLFKLSNIIKIFLKPEPKDVDTNANFPVQCTLKVPDIFF